MSKTFRSFLLVFAASVLILQLFNNSQAQDPKDLIATIKISGDKPTAADVSGGFWAEGSHKNPRNLSFLTDYAGVDGLGARISNVVTTGRDNEVPNTRIMDGEYVTKGVFLGWHYQVDLTSLNHRSAATHISFIKNDIGLLMLNDLLPQDGGDKMSAKVNVEAPDGWKIFTTAQQTVDGAFDVSDVTKTSFVIGKNWREINTGQIKLLISGEWQFTDAEAAKMASEIFDSYVKIFGSTPTQKIQIAIMKFPGDAELGNWEGDTRGTSITIASSDMPFKSQSLQRLHEQLRHEIFHLWIPNGVNLSGNYDWFYEGFALYQSLKIGVGTNRIRFDDMLDTLSRAYNIDAMQTQKLSLIDASKNRWNGSNTEVYARGMLVAFLCDLALLENSRGKLSTDDLLRDLYEHHPLTAPVQDANTTVLALLRSHSELVPIIDRNITGAGSIDWDLLLKSAGLEAETKDQITKLTVMAKPTGRQKDLLDKLGYNNWRKLTSRQ